MHTYHYFDTITGEYAQLRESSKDIEPAKAGYFIVKDQVVSRSTHWFNGTDVVEYTEPQRLAKAAAIPFKQWSNQTMAWVDYIAVDVAKEQKLNWAAAQREVADAAGFEFDGDTFGIDSKSLMKLQAVAVMVNSNPALLNNPNYRVNVMRNNGLARAMTARNCVDAYTAAVEKIIEFDDRLQTLRTAISACTTIDELNALEW